MEIDTNKIIGADELEINTEKTLSALLGNKELIIFEKNRPQFVIVSLDKFEELNGKKVKIISTDNNSPVKIGKLVQDTVRQAFLKNLIPKEELENLCEYEYSNFVLGLHFPMFRKFDAGFSLDEQKKDKKGRNRYYNFLLECDYGKFLLCSQWIEELHREKFIKWISKWTDLEV